MTLVIALNIIGCVGVAAAVVGSLAWAIRTQHHNHPPAAPARLMGKSSPQPRPSGQPRGVHPDGRPAYAPS